MHLADQSLLLLNSLPFSRHRCDLSGWTVPTSGQCTCLECPARAAKNTLEGSSANSPLQPATKYRTNEDFDHTAAAKTTDPADEIQFERRD
jgi:hypothetical protein